MKLRKNKSACGGCIIIINLESVLTVCTVFFKILLCFLKPDTRIYPLPYVPSALRIPHSTVILIVRRTGPLGGHHTGAYRVHRGAGLFVQCAFRGRLGADQNFAAGAAFGSLGINDVHIKQLLGIMGAKLLPNF